MIIVRAMRSRILTSRLESGSSNRQTLAPLYAVSKNLKYCFMPDEREKIGLFKEIPASCAASKILSL